MSDEDDITAEELQAVASEIAGAFPPPRAGTEIVLIDVNPHRAHAFWNIDLEEYRTVGQRAESLPMVIRIHDVTDIEFDGKNPHDTNDVIVSGMQGQSDLNLRHDGRTYLAEIGFRQPDGHLIRLATSERVEVPRAPVLRARAADLREPATAGLPTPADEARIGMAGILPLHDALKPTAAESPDALPASSARQEAGPWPDAEELAALVPPREEKMLAWYGKAEESPSAISIAQQSMEAEIAVLPEFVELPAGEGAPPVVAAAEAALPGEAQSDLAGPESAGPPRPSSVAAETASIRLEDLLTCSSQGLGRNADQVEVRVDVVIRGRVPPGREVTLFGRPVPTDAEGRFELRHELSHPGPLLPYLVPPGRAGG